jgi:hypothetical protein
MTNFIVENNLPIAVLTNVAHCWEICSQISGTSCFDVEDLVVDLLLVWQKYKA